jgi:serine/threonine-protein kinase HipA
MSRCLYCYRELEAGQTDFHPSCARKMFGSANAPILPYSRRDISILAERTLRSQITIPGVQEKLSLDLDRSGKQHRLTIVGLWGGYILKPQTDRFRCLPENEDLTMHLAELARISVVPHSLIRFEDGELCYITKRIDRGPNGEKFPMEDMCQLSERLTEYKYKGSYEQIAKIINKYSSVPKLDVVNFWELVIFSWLTGNADMHLKNFSLYSNARGSYSLAPAYDLLSTVLAMPEDKEELALTLDARKRKISRKDFETAMLASGLEEKIISNMFAKFSRAAASWLGFIDFSFLPADLKELYKELLAKQLQRMSI